MATATTTERPSGLSRALGAVALLGLLTAVYFGAVGQTVTVELVGSFDSRAATQTVDCGPLWEDPPDMAKDMSGGTYFAPCESTRQSQVQTLSIALVVAGVCGWIAMFMRAGSSADAQS